MEHVTPNGVFVKVGIDYAGPIYVKQDSTCKPTVLRAYVSVFVLLSVKVVHLELVSYLITEAFIACLRHFISHRGKPSTIWSDHGSNFVGATGQIKEFLQQQKTNETISDFCLCQNNDSVFILEHAPHFGGLWEAPLMLSSHLKN